MPGDEDTANVFAIPDFRQASKWLGQLGLETEFTPPFLSADLKSMLFEYS